MSSPIDTIMETKKKLHRAYMALSVVSLTLVIAIFFGVTTVAVLLDNEEELYQLNQAVQYLGTENNKLCKENRDMQFEVEYSRDWRKELNQKFPYQLPVPPLVKA